MTLSRIFQSLVPHDPLNIPRAQSRRIMNKNREQSIEHQMRYCTHYDPDALFKLPRAKTPGVCRAGVRYDELGKTAKDRPCILNSPFSNPDTSTCPQVCRVTREQAEKIVDDMDAAYKRAVAGITVAASWRAKQKPKADRHEVVECPICKGKLYLSQSSYNGHVRGRCETPNCVAWVE
jgi:hypothetical protein